MYKKKVKVAVGLLTLSSSLQAGNLWTDFRDKITAPIKSLLQSAGKEAAKGASTEFEAAINQVFDKKLQPLIDGVIEKFKLLGINTDELIQRTFAQLHDLRGKTKQDIEDILNKTKTDVISVIRTATKETDTVLENRINQLTSALIQALDKVEKIANNFTPGKFRTDLVDPLMNQLTGLETDIFNQLDELVEKVACTTIGTTEFINDMFNKTLDRIPLVNGQCSSCWVKCHICCNRVKMANKGSPTIFEKYRLGQCYTQVKLESMPENAPVQDVKDTYGDLHVLARLFYCSGVAIQSEPVMEQALDDAVQYHKLWQLWAH